MTDNMQIDDSRIIIDSKMWSTYNPDQTPNIEAVDNPPAGIEPLGDDLSPWPPAHLIYEGNNSNAFRHPAMAIQAFRHEVVSPMNRRPKPRNTQANSMLTFTLNHERR